MKVPFIYSKDFLQYDFGFNHPLNPKRLEMTYQRCKKMGILDKIFEAEPALEEDLLLFHSKNYIDAVKSIDEIANPYLYGLGTGDNPIFENMYEASLLYVGASLKALDFVLEGNGIAFNISGGLHHAKKNRASGFCIFNDCAVLISKALKKGLKVAYIDIDAHHGDGVQEAFYNIDRVLTISLHESGFFLFPGTGFTDEIGEEDGKGYSVNIPLAPGTSDKVYLWAFKEVVLPLVEVFKPDLIVTQLGIDTHYTDPLTDLNITLKGYVEVLKIIKDFEKPWVALGGGGYNPEIVSQAWSIAYSMMKGIDVNVMDKSILDTEYTKKFAKKSVQDIKEKIFKIHGL